MARIGVFSGKQEKWKRFDEDTEVGIRFINKAKLLEIQKGGAKQAKMSGGDIDTITNRLLGEEACFGWRNIEDHNHPGLLNADGAPIPFNDKNRDFLMKNAREFSNFVNEVAIDPKEFLESGELGTVDDGAGEVEEGLELELAKED